LPTQKGKLLVFAAVHIICTFVSQNKQSMVDISEIAGQLNSQSRGVSIDKNKLHEALETLINDVLFPICANKIIGERALYKFYSILLENLSAMMDARDAKNIADSFVEKLPWIREQLYEEAGVFNRNDPAAGSTEEVILAYPGFFALTIYRLSHELYMLKVPIIPRLFSEYAHSKVGIDINPGAKIGNSFYIDHGTGIVIGETTIIGDNVTIYQGVTLGALFVTKELSNKKRHPSIEDNVVIYAGATILGGTTVIGHDSVIGGNAWLTHSVPAYSLVQQNSEVRIRNILEKKDPIEFYI